MRDAVSWEHGKGDEWVEYGLEGIGIEIEYSTTSGACIGFNY
jgi:hypothetical protein